MSRWAYFDASALIKRYTPELGTPLLNVAFERLYPAQMTCAAVGLLEVVSILVRKHNDGRLTQAAYEQALIELRAEVDRPGRIPSGGDWRRTDGACP